MPKGSKDNVQFAGFVQVKIEESDTPKIEEEIEQFSDVANHLLSETQKGYRLSIGPEPDGESWKATFMNVNPKSSLAGWMLSGEGPSLEAACAVLYHKHFVVANRDWLPFRQAVVSKPRFR